MGIMNTSWTTLAPKKIVEKTTAALQKNGMNVLYAQNGDEAKQKALELIPKGGDVMDMTSQTLEHIGLTKAIQDSGKFDSIKKKLMEMNREYQGREMQELGSAPEWAVGSVNAVTENGEVLIASNTGSQLPAYAYGADHVIWVVGTQKIVKDMDQGMKRIYDYVLPLEAERAKKAYGAVGSNVSKLLVISREIKPDRITVIFANEVLGF